MATSGKKRVLITAISIYPDAPSGSAKLAFDEASFLALQGHEVWLAAPRLKADSPEYEICNGINFLRYERERHGPIDPRKLWQSRVELGKSLGRHCSGRFDVIHGHVPLQHDAATQLRSADTEACYSVHSPVVEELELSWQHGVAGRVRRILGLPLVKRIEQHCLKNSNRVTCFSQFTKTALSRHYGGLTERVEVIPGWTDLNRFRMVADRGSLKNRLGWRTDVPVLFTLRRLAPRMGLDRLIRAVEMLRAGGHRFQMVIGGTGMMRSSLEKMVSDLSLKESVRFEGYVPDEDLPSMFAACDAFVLPTAELECFGIIAVEAMACGRPVLATPVAAIPEMIGQIEPKWLASSAEVPAIARLLSEYLSGELPLHEPQRVRDYVASRYDREKVLPRFCAYILGEEQPKELKAE